MIRIHVGDEPVRVAAQSAVVTSGSTSQLINDSGYQTAEQVTAAVGAEAANRAAADEALKGEIEAAFIRRTASGNPAAFDDGADGIPVKSLVATLSYTGSGRTGCTIRRTGKNLLDTSHVTHAAWSKHNIPNTLAPNTTYTFSVSGDTGYAYSLWLASDASRVGGTTVRLAGYFSNGGRGSFTTPADMSDYPYLLLGGTSLDAGYDTAAHFQVELGAAATDYEPYREQAYTIDWSEEAGTVYGGSLEVTTGVLTSTLDENGDALAQPVIYQLTPVEIATLLGDNVFSADTGAVTVTYRADATKVIEKLTAAILSLGGNV